MGSPLPARFFDEIDSFINLKAELHTPFESNPIRLESKLSHWIAHSTFGSNFFQPILRGLPRQYLQTDPSISIIKKAFRNESLLIRHWLDRPLLTLYSQVDSSNCGTIQIALLTWVIADGWGDLFCQIETAKVLHSHFPNLKLTLFTLVHENKNPPSYDHPFEQHWLRFSGNLNGPITTQPFSPSQLKTLSQADLILEIPTPFPHLEKLLDQLKKTPAIARIGEHSMIDTIHYQPETMAWSMGLHFLEKGIFIKKVPPTPEKLLLKDQHLKQLLLGKAQSWEQYQQKSRFQITYTKNCRGLFLYLTALLSSLDKDRKDIDICFFQMELLAYVLEHKFKDPHSQKYPHLKDWNIKEVHLYFEKFRSIIPIAKSGKKLRLIHCRSLDHDDQLVLTSLSDRLIGATGDQSVLEAISTGKPFFFDPPPFKRPFLRDLLCIAEKKLQEFPCLAQFFKLCLKNPNLPLEDNQEGWVSEDYLEIMAERISLEDNTDVNIGIALGHLLKEPKMPRAFESLRQYLTHFYSIDPILTGLVHRILLIRHNPSLLQQEEAQVQKLLNGQQTLDQMLLKLSC